MIINLDIVIIYDYFKLCCIYVYFKLICKKSWYVVLFLKNL